MSIDLIGETNQVILESQLILILLHFLLINIWYSNVLCLFVFRANAALYSEMYSFGMTLVILVLLDIC